MSLDPFAAGSSGDFEVDLTAYKTPESIHIPAGWYTAEVVSVEKGVSRNHNPQWTWKFMITEGPHEGQMIPLFTAITPQALWKVGEVVTALGLGVAGQVAKFDLERAVGRRAAIRLEDDDYNGDVRSVIKRVKPHTDGPAAAPSEDAA